MKIQSPCVVELTWILKDAQGELLDDLNVPVAFLVGGHDLFEKIELALMGFEAGEQTALYLEPEDAFGVFREELIFLEPRGLFPPELEEGMTIEGHALPPGCHPQAPTDALFTVTDIYPEHVVLDGNHPLAGMGLQLAMQVCTVREATDDELERGSAGTGFFKIPFSAPGSDSLH